MNRQQSWRRLWWVVWGIVALWVGNWRPMAVSAQERCFPETGYCIDGDIRNFWEAQGGLPVFGFPIAAPMTTMSAGQPIVSQLFERQRIEYHAANPAPYTIQLGRLGADVLTAQGRAWQEFPKDQPQTGCRYFETTGFTVCGAFLARWNAYGIELDGVAGYSDAEHLALFGLPISPLQEEVLSNGQRYQVQWFERTRMEWHPEQPAAYQVLHGLLAHELTSEALTSATSTPVPQMVVSEPTAMSVATATVTPPQSSIPAGSIAVRVLRVVDGDTIHVDLDGQDVTIRMIGIDTPETKDPRKPVQCYGREASDRAKQLLDNQQVYLETDASQGVYDKYQRLLAYVWLPDGRQYNQLMIADGYAFEYTYARPYVYQQAFKNAQQQAQTQQRGLWSPATCNGIPSPVDVIATVTTTATSVVVGGGDDGAYPCVSGQIKGNRNSLIYHVPGGAWYARTTANVACFDTEQAAIAAGFRRASR